MKTIRYILLTILFSAISYNNLFPQEPAKFVFPKVSLVFHDARFIDTVKTIASSKNIPGSRYSLPVVTVSKFLVYKLSLSIIIRDKGNITQVPLTVKITSPQNNSQEQMLETDISKLDINKIYDYNLNVNTNSSGWFSVELVSDIKNPESLIVLGKYQVYFGN